jgi:geranylgeranyl reductase family protein
MHRTLAVRSLAQVSEPDVNVDVLVVGAGPAGISAAIELHRNGRDVVVVDKAVFPRDKCCGDGLTTLALRELDALGLDPDVVEDWFDLDGAWLRSPGGRQIHVPLPTTGRYAAVATRRSLDHALVGLARDAGVTVRDGIGFESVATHDTGSVTVSLTDGSVVRCRYLIGADGMWSPVRKSVGANVAGYRGEWHAFRQYHRNVTGPAADRLIVWFEPDLLPGYAWSFPLPGGRVNIGFGVLRGESRRVRDMASIWRDLLGRAHVTEALGPHAEPDGRHTAWPIPARVDDVELAVGRVLFVGDAACATDVMTGEGIGQALLTGRLAAEAITAAGATRPDAAAERYRSAVEHELFADHRMSLRLGRILASPRGAETALGIVAASGSWGRRNFARWMFEDEPRAIAVSPRRWHRRMLRRPGAYQAA